MALIRHKINGGLATASEASVEKLIATGHWERVDGTAAKAASPKPKRTTAPRRTRRAAAPKETSTEE